MIVVYTPAGGEPQHFDATSLRVSEAAIVQRTVDMKWQEVLAALGEDDVEAMRAIVWVIRKRAEPSLRYAEFDPGVSELTSRMSNEEMQRYIEAAFEAGQINGELDRGQIADILRGRIADVAVDVDYARSLIDKLADEAPKEEAAEPPEQSGDPSPSLTSPSPGTSTSGSSPMSSTSPLPGSMTSSLATSTT